MTLLYLFLWFFIPLLLLFIWNKSVSTERKFNLKVELDKDPDFIMALMFFAVFWPVVLAFGVVIMVVDWLLGLFRPKVDKENDG